MGNCYARRQSDQNYIDKNIRVQRKMGAEISISKSAQKIGVDANLIGKLETSRQEIYNKSSFVNTSNKETQTHKINIENPHANKKL